MTGLLVAVLDGRTAVHLLSAIRTHRAALHRNGHPVPAGLGELEELVLAAVRGDSVSDRQVPPADGETTAAAASVDDVLAYSIPAAANLLGLSARTVERLVAAGKLPSLKLGGARRIARSELDRILSTKGNR